MYNTRHNKSTTMLVDLLNEAIQEVALTEAFNSAVAWEYEKVRRRSSSHDYVFNIGDIKYRASLFLESSRGVYALDYTYDEENIVNTLGWHVDWAGNSNVRVWGFVFDANGSQEITGSGNQFQVFATIGSIFKDAVKRAKPDVILFKAEEASRVRLYNALLPKMAKSIGYGYTYTGEIEDELFILYKK